MDQDSKSLSMQRYSQYGDAYVTSKTHAKGAELDLLVELAQPQPDWVVLDVATGGGHTALKFAPLVKKVIATDLTPKMVERARDFITALGIQNVEFRLADAEDLPFEHHEFALVTCRIAPHHFPDCARFVCEAWRVLKPGGILLVQDHMLPEDQAAARYVDKIEKLRDPSHNRGYSHSEWLVMFQGAGLRVDRTEAIIKRHTFIPWAERQGCTPDTKTQLKELFEQAPPLAAEWLAVQDLGSPEASFINHHILIAGRKAI